MTAAFYEDEKITGRDREISSKAAFGKLLPLLTNHVRGLIGCLVLLLSATGLSLVWPILLKRAVDIDIAGRDFTALLWTAATIGLIQAATLVLQYLQRIKLEIIGQAVMIDLKRRLFDHILSLDVSFFDRNPVGRLMARVESDTESLRLMFTNTVVLVVGDIFLILGVYTVMFYYSWRLAVVLLAVGPFVGLLVFIFERKTTRRFFEVRKKMAEVTARITEMIQGMSIIQIFHRSRYAREMVNRANELKFRDDSYVNIAVCLFFNTVFFFQYLMIASVLFLGAVWASSGVVTVGVISMFVVLIWRLFEPIWRASEQLANIQKAVAGARRIFALLSEQPKLPEAAQPVKLAAIKHGITFDHVWFSYTGDENWSLKDATFEIPVGKRFALVGVTGGGKTTVISLLLRLYDPQRGKIMIDGIDIRDIAKADLRGRFALVLQDIVLFPGDVQSNIALEDENISREDIMRAAQTVEADRFITRLPEGYATEVSEKGANFSRGERQLLSFARALVTDPDVMLLDEATSSVDPETERLIQGSLKKLMAGRTSLVIAHRLSTILDVDEILVIRKGEIVERGTHTALLLNEGYYSRLFHLQFKQTNGVLSNAG